MVEQRKSFPQAVPSSIYMGSQYKCSLQSQPHVKTWETSSQGSKVMLSTLRALTKLPIAGCGMVYVSWGWSYVVAGEVVDSGLGQHAVVCERCQSCPDLLPSTSILTLELRLPERRGVAGNDDELGLARAQRLEGGLVAESDLARLCGG